MVFLQVNTAEQELVELSTNVVKERNLIVASTMTGEKSFLLTLTFYEVLSENHMNREADPPPSWVDVTPKPRDGQPSTISNICRKVRS